MSNKVEIKDAGSGIVASYYAKKTGLESLDESQNTATYITGNTVESLLKIRETIGIPSEFRLVTEDQCRVNLHFHILL